MTTGAEHGEIAEVGSPVIIPCAPIDERRPWRWTTSIIVVATVFLATFNAGTAMAWLEEQPPSLAVERLRGSVEAWDRATSSIGAGTVRARLHGWWERAQATRFVDEKPGKPGAP